MKITNEQFWHYLRALCDEAHLNAVGATRSGQEDSVQAVKQAALPQLQPNELEIAGQVEAILAGVSS